MALIYVFNANCVNLTHVTTRTSATAEMVNWWAHAYALNDFGTYRILDEHFPVIPHLPDEFNGSYGTAGADQIDGGVDEDDHAGASDAGRAVHDSGHAGCAGRKPAQPLHKGDEVARVLGHAVVRPADVLQVAQGAHPGRRRIGRRLGGRGSGGRARADAGLVRRQRGLRSGVRVGGTRLPRDTELSVGDFVGNLQVMVIVIGTLTQRLKPCKTLILLLFCASYSSLEDSVGRLTGFTGDLIKEGTPVLLWWGDLLLRDRSSPT